jgi:cytochrome b
MRTYIWSLPTRAFHWFLAFGFVFAWFSGDFEYLRNLHYAFGAYVGVLLFLRLLYGFIGPRHSRFSDFPIGLKHQSEYLWSITGKVKDYAGHNPLASVIMILIILTGIVAAVTGYIYYTSLVKLAGELKELRIGSLHHIFSTLFLILVMLHLAGVIADVVLRKDAGNFRSMFTGYKPLKAEEGELNLSQKIFALVWMLLPFFFFYLAFLLPV